MEKFKKNNLSVISDLILGFFQKAFSFIFTKLGSLIFYLLIVNFASKKDADIFFLANSIFLILYPLSSLGLCYSVIKFFPKYNLKKMYKEVLSFITSSLVVLFIIWIIFYFILYNLNVLAEFFRSIIFFTDNLFFGGFLKPILSTINSNNFLDISHLYFLIWANILIATLYAFFNTILISLKKFQNSMLVDLSLQIPKLVFLPIFLFFNLSSSFFIYLSSLLGYVGGFFTSIFFISKWFSSIKEKITFNLSPSLLIQSLKFGFPFMLNSLIEVIVVQLDILLVAYFLGNQSGMIAAYALISNFVKNIPSFVIYPLFSSQQVILVEENEKKSELFKKISTNMIKWILFLGLSIAGFFVLFGKYMLLILAPSYLSFSYLFWFFIPFILADLTSASLRMAIFAKGYIKILFIYTLIVLLSNLTLNILLIPIFSLMGAAIASSIAMVVGTLFILYYSNKKFGFMIEKKAILGIISFLIVLFTFSYLIDLVPKIELMASKIFFIIFLAGLYLIFYWFLIILFKGVNSKDFKIILAFFEELKIRQLEPFLNLLKKIFKFISNYTS
ncbi:MAG: oligosaccharide flippase family protein [Candidatus Omnitrophica bacterium]|nr:oligosaccharide flippase family protein [Candidatus Omnitrophota bacterium]